MGKERQAKYMGGQILTVLWRKIFNYKIKTILTCFLRFRIKWEMVVYTVDYPKMIDMAELLHVFNKGKG